MVWISVGEPAGVWCGADWAGRGGLIPGVSGLIPIFSAQIPGRAPIKVIVSSINNIPDEYL
ncbi:hypothetical protein GCM10008986_11180 [Salinibacillus aidingensis]|uniref:Uncharacterized protein n=1 Tax=Salinibacillus aidingensis TaxID=237684 RepID=A0ABN1B009_9BACI